LSNLFDLLTSEDDRESRARRVHGVTVGIVTRNNDPDGLGRVKLFFPWLSDNNETEWARIATLMAGSERGSFFLPDVGDEVLVAFEHGDINRPFVIGGLWSREDKAPTTNSDGLNNIKKIKSRSGHEIIFDDTDAKENLEIRTKGGHQILLDDGSGSEKIMIKDKTGSNLITIDSLIGSISISSLTDISLKATKIDIEALAMINLKAPVIMNQATATITSQAPTIANQAQGAMSCMATGTLVLKGTPLVMS
jgi:uncharacterized protein involved in type VI secretion and phage assembly